MRLNGRVVAPDSPLRWSDVRAFEWRRDDGWDSDSDEVEVDRNGRFTIDFPGPGDYVLRVSILRESASEWEALDFELSLPPGTSEVTREFRLR